MGDGCIQLAGETDTDPAERIWAKDQIDRPVYCQQIQNCAEQQGEDHPRQRIEHHHGSHERDGRRGEKEKVLSYSIFSPL